MHQRKVLKMGMKFWFDAGGRTRQIDKHDASLTDMDKRISELAKQPAAHQLESERQFAKVQAVAAPGARKDFDGKG